MTSERRYDDDEVRRIFELAADQETRPAATAGTGAGEGLTLPELQAIGREVGLPPERVAEAATALDRADAAAAPVRRATTLGLPLSVGHAVDLPRPLTDHEWAVLVGEIRETFGARGRVVSQGDLREWSNGNLHIVQEATETGHRLRLHTTRETGLVANRIGAAMLTLAAIVLGVMLVLGNVAEDLAAFLILAGIGLAALGYNAITLPPWARERARQMDGIADRALELTTVGAPPDAP